MKPTLEEDCFTEELLLDLTLDEELTDELDLSLLLLDESSDFTELELLESEEVLVSFAELLDTSAGSEPLKLLDDLSFSIFSSLDPFDSADAPLRVTLESGDSTDELETLVSSELADDESSQAVRAKNAASTPTRAKTVNFFANVFFIGKPFGIYSESLTQRTENSLCYRSKYSLKQPKCKEKKTITYTT